MKKLKLITETELAISKDTSIYCDFCGDHNKTVFTSSYIDNPEITNTEMQICEDCIKQLYKLLTK
jgi:hypothetical protein